MRHLHSQELALVSGAANDYQVDIVIDPVMAIQTAIYLMNNTDRKSFVSDFSILGMMGGMAAGALIGVHSYSAQPVLSLGVALAAMPVCALAGGIAMKGVSIGLVGMYDFIIG